MLIGVVGAPNKGKSTFFSAATLVDAAIANYPFTTITPNRGVTYVRSPCPHVTLGLPKCDAKNSKCANGVRLVPISIIDVAGLVPGAHEGKGLGNKFLDDLRQADALIQIVDGTGSTDLQGNPCTLCDPYDEVGFLHDEIVYWLVDIMKRAGKKEGGVKSLAEALSGLKITEAMLHAAALECGLDIGGGLPDDEGVLRIARALLPHRMPFALVCNKMDVHSAKTNLESMKKLGGDSVFGCSAAVELALRKASEHGMISYVPGDSKFEVVGSPDQKQLEALKRMAAFISENDGSGVQQTIDWVVYKKLNAIVVYPVEDEHRFSNHKGDVLPDAWLVPKGTTAHQLAGMVHTDLAQKFIGAVDVKRKMRIGADHVLSDGDVVRIVAGH